MHDVIVRTCGGCTACCWTHSVPSIKKKAETACPFCTTSGCGRYETRPHECAEFTCAWLYGEGSEDDRPDTGGLILGAAEFVGIADGILTIHETIRGAFTGSSLAAMWLGCGKESRLAALVIPIEGAPTLFIPRGFDIRPQTRRLITEDSIAIVEYEA